jgi:membrane protease YdiL (CAAX protease family)
MENDSSLEHHSMLRSAVLSLLPGLVILIFFVILVPLSDPHVVPPTLVLFVVLGLVLVPLELGYLLFQGKKLNGRLSLKGIVLFRDKISLWQLLWMVPVLLAWTVGCFAFLGPRIDPVIADSFFKWLPAWFFPDMSSRVLAQYSGSVLSLMVVLGFVFNALLGPIVEELYFRGYLLPRLSHLGAWAPALNTVLFSLYHLFSPWQNVTRMLALFPYVYAVWWKRNIYVGMITHCALNTFGMIMMTTTICGR